MYTFVITTWKHTIRPLTAPLIVHFCKCVFRVCIRVLVQDLRFYTVLRAELPLGGRSLRPHTLSSTG